MLHQSATHPTLIQSLQRGLQLVEAVTDRGPLTARELSEVTGIVLPTTYHLLRTLIHEGYLRRCVDGRYTLGDQLASVTQLERRARGVRLLREEMAELSAQGRVSMSLGLIRGDEIVVSHFVAHPCAPRVECWSGMTIPGHATALGKAILARMQPPERADYLTAHPPDALTNQTVTTLRRLEGEINQSGPIHSDQQYLYGVSCAAVPLGRQGALAALSATYSSARTARFRDQIDELLFGAEDRIVDAMNLTVPVI